MAGQDPALKAEEPYRSVLAGDVKALAADGGKFMVQALARTHSGMTTEAFAKTVSD